MKKKWIAAITVYAALLIACIIVIYAVPSLKGMLEQTYVTEYGKIDITDEISAYIVRDETVYVAAQDSKVKRVAKPDVLIKAGTSVVELTPVEEKETAGEAGPDASQEEAEAAAEANGEAPDNISRKYTKVMEELGTNVVSTKSGKTKEAGYISYFIDGAETLLSTDRLADISQSDFESLTKLRTIDTPDKDCGKGDPLFKVTDNRKWYLVFYIDNKAGEKYYEGRTVSIEINGRTVPAKVARVDVGKKTTKVALSCKEFYEGFADIRTMDTTVTAASAEGLVRKDSSIVKKGEQEGVFVKNKLGEHIFKPVLIKADDGERCVVYSDIYVDENGNFVETIKTYDEIVTAPDEEEVAELQKQLKREEAEAAAQKAEEEKEAAERAASEKAAAQRAQERAEAQLAGQKASQGKPAETEEARQKAAPSEQESEDAIGIPQEDNSGGEYTEDVSTEVTDTED